MSKIHWAPYICLIFMFVPRLHAFSTNELVKLTARNIFNVLTIVVFEARIAKAEQARLLIRRAGLVLPVKKLLNAETRNELEDNLHRNGIHLMVLNNELGETNQESLIPTAKKKSAYGSGKDPEFIYDEQANSGLYGNAIDCNVAGQCAVAYFTNKRGQGLRKHNAGLGVVLKAPQYPEHLPAAEPILPGHTLLRPARGMLKSAIKYPLRDVGGATVYGNLDNVGITHGKTPQRILYTDFRKHSNLMRKHNAGIEVVLNPPQYPENLPAAEPIYPGHSLLRPAKGMLKSAIKYPLRDVGGATVYGNLDNVGITHGKTPQRILYSDFRKHNNLMTAIQNAMANQNKRNSVRSRPMIVIELDPSSLETIKEGSNTYFGNQIGGGTASTEILDDINALYEDGSKDTPDFRRKRKKHWNRDKEYGRSKDDDTSKEASEENEKNPGNPFTIYKNKYKQNWLWNHEMDGDHMNINPHSPTMDTLGPTGAELFFGRKWWYFNQDDYRPM